jgi:hypothetical protein
MPAPGQPPLPLRHDLPLERGVPVTGHLDLHLAEVGDHGLGPVAVAGVTAIPPVMPGPLPLGAYLAFQGALQHDLGHPA